MRTIKNEVENEIVIKNSRFITLFMKLKDSSIMNLLEEIQKKYPKATHYCYAYVYDKDKGCSDDGEPSKTAGAPMLNVLEKENLNHVLVVTIRYFGGIKLGAGGLVRAYTKSVTEALKLVEYQELVEAYQIKITFDYKDERQIHYLVGDSILSKDYQEMPTYIALIEKEKLDALHNYTYEILEETYIEKDS